MLKFLSGFISIVISLAACTTINRSLHHAGDSGSGSSTEVKEYEDTRTTLLCNLLDAGYDQKSTAAILGNIYGESKYRPDYLSKVKDGKLVGEYISEDYKITDHSSEIGTGGFGLAQWHYADDIKSLQNKADGKSASVTSATIQTSYLIKTLSEYNLGPSELNDRTKYSDLSELVFHVAKKLDTTIATAYIGCTESTLGSCKNKESAAGVSAADLIAHKSDLYETAYTKIYEGRYKEAEKVSKLSTSDCNETEESEGSGSESGSSSSGSGSSGSGSSGSGSSGSGSSGSGSSGSGSSSSGSSGKQSTTIKEGAVGKTSLSGYYRQFDDDIKNKVWRKNDNGPDKEMKKSGCSLIAVANALKAVGRGVSPKTMISWSVNNITSAGWGASVEPLARKYGLNLTSNLFSSVSTSISKKEEKIRAELSAGRAVIVSGARNDVSEYSGIDCEKSSNINAGKCVFSRNGHFITIIGITKDGKALVANSANGGNKKFPLSEVLKAAKYARGAY